MPKTFSTRELLARLRAVTRRSQMAAQNQPEIEEINFGDVKINPATREVFQNEQPVNLTALEFDLLLCLARFKNRVLDRDKLPGRNRRARIRRF